MTLLETLLSLAIGLFLVGVMVKLYSLQALLHDDIQQLSGLNRQAIITRQIFANEIESSLQPVTLIDNPHQIKLGDKIFYISRNNLYIKKNNDFSVELVSGVKNLTAKKINGRIEINATVYIKEKGDETKRVYPNNGINLHFFVKPHCIIESGNVCP